MSHDRFRYGLIAAAFAVSVLFFIRLPAIVGRVPPLGFDTVARILTSFTLPAAAFIILLIFRSLAKRDPLRANYERFRRTYEISLDLAAVLVLGTHLLLATVTLQAAVFNGCLILVKQIQMVIKLLAGLFHNPRSPLFTLCLDLHQGFE